MTRSTRALFATLFVLAALLAPTAALADDPEAGADSATPSEETGSDDGLESGASDTSESATGDPDVSDETEDDAPAPFERNPMPLSPDRVGGLDASTTVGALTAVLETGLDWSRTSGDDDAIHDSIRSPVKLRFGVHEFAEIHLITDGFAWDRTLADGNSLGAETGASDILVGTKVNVPSFGESAPSTGAIVSLLVPTGSEAFTSDIYALVAGLLLDQALPAGLAIGVNLGATIPVTDRETTDDSLRYGLALGWSAAPIDERLSLFAELYGDTTMSSDPESLIYVNGGAAWAISEVLMVDLAVRAGLTSLASDVGIASGFSIRL